MAGLLDVLDGDGAEADFWSRVSIPSADPAVCWIWQGTIRKRYGAWQPPRSARRWYLAHRVAWAAYWGVEPEDWLVIRHACDNPPCVNPAHLRLGTAKQNTEDAFVEVVVHWCPGCGVKHTERVARFDPRQGLLFPL